ncbi:MAG: linear amide C-N hydrolase [Bacteroidales bacterium]|nr:linear amide C-N hydrolase [Bacteroidales bacterium]
MELNNCCKSTKLLMFGVMMSTMLLSSCGDDSNESPKPTPTDNEARLLTDENKRAMVYSMVDLEGDKGRIYEINYTEDYKLDAALDADIDGVPALLGFVMQNLLDVQSTKPQAVSYGAGCSAFACPDKTSGDFLMGRNFDFNHIDATTGERTMIPVIAVHTAPKGGKKSVSFVDGLFIGYKSGFYTDGKSDLSMLMALPYVLLDGINEDGFAICVLKLDGKPTKQEQPGKKKIFTTVAMRMLLDRASTVKEAVEMLKQYNMCMDSDPASYHYLMADATGDFAIVEYTNSDLEQHPDKMEVHTGDDAWRYVTNFYVSSSMADTDHGFNHSTHGMARYLTLRDRLAQLNYRTTPAEAFALLQDVAQGPENPELSTGFTQWTEVYNLSRKSLTLSILREWNKSFEFKVK